MFDVTRPSYNHHDGLFVVPQTHTLDPTGNMAQDKEERTLGLSPAQVAGSALAAVTGALLASFAGTTGTIIGTAVGSIVATVGAAIYTWSLRRTSAAVVRTAAQVRQAALINAALPRPGSTGGRPRKDQTRDGSGSSAAEEAVAKADADVAEAAADAESARRSIPWGKALIASAAVTVAALGGITAFEAITGQPISSLLGGNDSQGTSVGNLVRTENTADQDPVPSEPSATPTEEESQTPSPDAEPSTEPTAEPTPTDTPSAEPSETVEPTEEPTVTPDGGGDQPVPNEGAGPEDQPGSDADGGADAGAGAAPDNGPDTGSDTTN